MYGFRKSRQDEARQVIHRTFERTELATHERSGESCPLPELVVVGLGDRRPEPLSQLCLQRLNILPLPLERPALREMQIDLDDRDVTQSVRSTWAFSYTSITSPSLMSM